jgi:phosphatidylglycerophosphatase A
LSEPVSAGPAPDGRRRRPPAGNGTLRAAARFPRRGRALLGPEAGLSIAVSPQSGPRVLAVAFATAGGVGFVPLAPGTCGAGLAIAIFVLFSPVAPGLLALTWLALVGLGAWAADAAEGVFGPDDGRIVIDEVAGQLLALSPLLAAGAERRAAWLVTGFVLFRVFDVWKPGPVRWAERRFGGGVGVMMDDVVAGLLAGAVLAGLLAATAAHAGEAA